jgi:hypothetical protein
MPQGLQIWDASGNLIFDTSSSIGRQTGAQTVGPSPSSGTITVPGYDTGATVWYIAPFSMTLGDPPTILDFDTVTYTVSGANISWQAFDAIRIIYGVY